MKSVVLDENTKAPVQVQIEIKAPDGKVHKLKSDPGTGEFEFLLDGGQSYELTFSGENVFRTKETVTLDKVEGYKEKNYEFTLNEIKPGNRIYNFDLFKPGSDEFDVSANSKLEDIKMNLRFNRSVFLDFLVKGENNSLAEARVKKIQDVVDKWHASKARISIKPSTTKNESNFVVYVNKIDNPFD